MIPLDQLKQKTIAAYRASIKEKLTFKRWDKNLYALEEHSESFLTKAIEEAWEAGVNSEDIKDPL